MTACKRVLSYVAEAHGLYLRYRLHRYDRHAYMTTGQMGYQKLYFENSTYKYYIRKHMQVLKIQKKAYKEQSFIFSTGVAKRLLLAGKCSAMKT